jgi:perosamine synthetase
MTDWKIPLYKIFTDDEDLNLITKVIRRGNNWAMGPEIEEFENSIKNYVNADYCLALNSGTSALHASLLAYGIQPNDEIIVPSFSFIATANSVLFVDGKPVFADIEEDTFGLDPKSILKNITPKTKCIIPMDYGGQGCKIFDIKKIAEDNDLVVIEDGAESLGSSVNGKKIGSISDTTIFSFCGNKVLTTGEGGAVVTNSSEIYEKIKLIRSHGRVDTSDYFSNPSLSQYVGLGYNWRMSTLTATLGISQLQKIDKIIKMRKDNARFLSDKLSKIPQIKTPEPVSDHEHIYQMYTIRLENEKTRDDLHNFLTRKSIFSKIYFQSIHQTHFYTKFNLNNTLNVTEMISKQVLTIPLYPNMTHEEKDYLVSSILEFFESR